MNDFGLYPDVFSKAMLLINSYKDLHGKELRITQGFRSYDEQKNLYEQGRSKPGNVVTWALPGSSFHNFHLAFDVCFNISGDPYLDKHDPASRNFLWRELGRIGSELGLRWGGSFKDEKCDLPHFECSYNFKLSEIRTIYELHGKDFLFITLDKKRFLP